MVKKIQANNITHRQPRLQAYVLALIIHTTFQGRKKTDGSIKIPEENSKILLLIRNQQKTSKKSIKLILRVSWVKFVIVSKHATSKVKNISGT